MGMIVLEARCAHFSECGGCLHQTIPYEQQLVQKQEQVHTLFAPIFHQDNPTIHPILGCEDPWHYRNKMEFSFSEDKKGTRYLGLMIRKGRGRVVDLGECHLVSGWFTETLEAVRNWWVESGLQAYFHRKDSGHLRTLTLREAKHGKGKMVMLTVSGNPDFALSKKDLESFVAALPEVDDLSVFLQVQQIAKGKPTQFFEMLLKGKDHITEKLTIEVDHESHTLECKISPTSFFQPNTKQAEILYSRALSFVDHLEEKVVFDLYCGSATIGMSAAKKAKEVIGIELNPHAVFDANWNIEVNGIKNLTVYQGDVGMMIPQIEKTPDLVIVDPPRMGLNPTAMDHLIALNCPEILYVSCNPKTQVENIQKLSEQGYRLKTFQCIDQFPHTAHVETIAYLQKG